MTGSGKFLQKTCLKPHYSLKRQLLTSFGLATFITLTSVVIVSIALLNMAGKLVKERGSDVMKEQVRARMVATTITTAEAFGQYYELYHGTLQQVVEITMDRIVGYPNSGWEEDVHVPFYDIDSQSNVYPLKADPVPLEWRIERDVTDENFAQVFPGRNATKWLSLAKDSTTYSTGSFFMQGQCDPEMKEPLHASYYPNCTEAHNNVKTGGVVKPTSTAWGLYNKSGDLAILLRPLHEANADILFLGIHFLNSGAGATVSYPGVYRVGSYESQGCDWLRGLTTSTGEKLASEEDIARCHPKGTTVKAREHNPVEREFFRDAVKNPGASWFGPYRQIGLIDVTLLTSTKAVFDRRTGALIGVAYLTISTLELDEILKNSRLFERSEWGILSFDDGRVLSDSLSSTSDANSSSGSEININWWDLGILSKSSFTTIRDKYKTLFATNWTNETLAAVAESVEDVLYGMATAYPLPVPPQNYDPKYAPHSLAVQVVTYDAYSVVEEFQSSIDDDILTSSLIAIVIGLLGMFVILVLLWCVARVLTQPLLWMELVSWRIVNHGATRSGNSLPGENDDVHPAMVRCIPRTEITQLVEEFRLMITGFSGGGASTAAKCQPNEIRNTLTWQSDFKHLYTTESAWKSIRPSTTIRTASTEAEDNCSDLASENRNEINCLRDDGEAPLVEAKNVLKSMSTKVVFPAPPKKHRGPVAASLSEDRPSSVEDEKNVYRSSLFCWIVVLIVLPLVLTNTAITVIITRNIRHDVPAWVDNLSHVSLDLEIIALSSIAKSKATLLKRILQDPVRDLHWYTRMAGWLYFNAVPRAASFTEFSAATEPCKSSPEYECEILQTDPFKCPCEWNDSNSFNGNCTPGFNQSESRRRQTRFYAVLAQDIDPTTGNRSKAVSYPKTAYSPETTLWQTNASQLPGAQKGVSAAGFATTYDRLRVSSALGVVELPIYNYREAAGYRRYHMVSKMGYEADGMMIGFFGCLRGETTFAGFQSSETNKAFEISEELCPEGKYGFDPRCREWYNITRTKYWQSRRTLHMTAPFYFSDGVSVGLVAGSPIANPISRDFIGVASLSCAYQLLLGAFSLLKFPISFLITPETDIYGGDTVVGLNKTAWTRSSIVDELFQYSGTQSKERLQFEKDILALMKSGHTGSGRLSRRRADGEYEGLFVAYAPVNLTIISPLDPRNLKNGVTANISTTYSLAVVNFDSEVRRPFAEVEATSLSTELDRLAVIEAVLSLILSIVFLVLVCKVNVHLTRPMLTLLRAVRNINSNEGRRDIPPLSGGSREVHQVYNSFSKLYKILRIANDAFFSGNLALAHQIVTDAIQLFREIDDRKAIGIACNNLGNTMLARILELGKHNLTSSDGYRACASQCFNEAVELSQNGFDAADSNDGKVAFAQELADRLFNRGLFLLIVGGVFDTPENRRRSGLQDLRKARDLDDDVKEYYIENKLLIQFSDECFNRMLRRIHGLCTFYSDKEVISLWDPERLVDEADKLLFASWQEYGAPLFREMSRVGRLQQLEGAAIRLETCKGNREEAARIGMRMFTEDEYLLEGPFSFASSALLNFAQSDACKSWSSKTGTSLRSALRKMSRSCRSPTWVLGKGVVFALELNERLESDPIFPFINSNCMNLFDNHCFDEDFIGMVAYTVKGDQTLGLSSYADHKSTQRRVLDLATRSTSESVCSALPFAMQVILDSSISQEVDTYVLLFTDGYSWDSGPYSAIKFQIEQMNRENESNVHLIVIGVDVESEHIEECKSMGNISKRSFFVELTMENMDETFSRVSSMFSTGRLYHQFMGAPSMEQF